MTPKEKRIVYFSFLGLGPLTFAVPRRVFCRFLRCLPVVERVSGGEQQRGVERPTLLSAGTLGLGGEANTDESVVGLKLLHRLGRVVDEGEASGLATTELCAEAKDADLLLLGLVEAGELVAELLLGDVGAAGVEDVPVDAKSAKSHRLIVRPDPSIPTPRDEMASSKEDAETVSGLTSASSSRKTRRSRSGSVAGERDSGTGGKNSHDHLLAAQQRVADELARAQGHGGVGVGHLRDVVAVVQD